MSRRTPGRRNLTPPLVAQELGVAVAKVIGWIRAGELQALDLANRGSTRPRYSISPESLEAFKKARQVVPLGEQSAAGRLRRQSKRSVREFF